MRMLPFQEDSSDAIHSSCEELAEAFGFPLSVHGDDIRIAIRRAITIISEAHVECGAAILARRYFVGEMALIYDNALQHALGKVSVEVQAKIIARVDPLITPGFSLSLDDLSEWQWADPACRGWPAVRRSILQDLSSSSLDLGEGAVELIRDLCLSRVACVARIQNNAVHSERGMSRKEFGEKLEELRRKSNYRQN